MNREIYYVFSDEKGSWNNPKEIFYIRSWLKINSDDYIRLKVDIENILEIYGIETQELKWTNRGILKENQDIIDRIFKEANLEIFISFSILDEFYKRTISPREYLFQVLDKLDLSNESRKEYLQKIPRKIKGSINYLLFLNIYERYQAENMLERLISDQNGNYIIFFDKPQFLEKDFGKLIGSVVKGMYPSLNSNFKKRIVDSKDYLGIQIADIIVGCFYSILKNNFLNSQSILFFKKFIKPKLVSSKNVISGASAGNVIPGINKVMFNKGDDQIDLIKNIRSKL